VDGRQDDRLKRAIVTSKVVAEKAGVSRSAVSRCFTPGATVSKKTRAKVLAVATALGYQPNALARTLIKGQSKIVGLVVGYFSNPFYPQAVELLSNKLSANGYHVLLFFSSSESNESIVDQMLQYQCDVAILMSTTLSSVLHAALDQQDIPTILFNRIDSSGHGASVTADNYNGGYAIGEYLCVKQAKRIAYVAGLQESSTNQDRKAGFLSALEKHHQRLYEEIPGDYDANKAARLVKSLFVSATPSPDAIFVANDHMAYAVMDMIRYDLQLNIPGDVLIVGFDDAPLSASPSYSLTTYSQPLEPMVSATIELFKALVQGNSQGIKNYAVPGRFIRRNSSEP
jgi:DNA-binding LacI/PurR family transcriptional regulator